MALKKSELYSSLWSSCDELRGSPSGKHVDEATRARLRSYLAGFAAFIEKGH